MEICTESQTSDICLKMTSKTEQLAQLRIIVWKQLSVTVQKRTKTIKKYDMIICCFMTTLKSDRANRKISGDAFVYLICGLKLCQIQVKLR